MAGKQLQTDYTNHQSRFNDNLNRRSGLTKFYLALSWQIQSFLYLARKILVSNVFYPPSLRPDPMKNFNKESRRGYTERTVQDLAGNFGITERSMEKILLEWESRLIPHTNVSGIKDFIIGFVKYYLAGKGVDFWKRSTWPKRYRCTCTTGTTTRLALPKTTFISTTTIYRWGCT